MDEIQAYLDKITPQHRAAPRFLAWTQANLALAGDLCDAAASLDAAFDPKRAVGRQLRALLYIAGIEDTARLPDEDLRRLLLSKIIKNQWNGTLAGIMEIWPTVFGEELRAEYIDHQDMTTTLNLTGDRPTDFLRVARIEGAIPKPAGVHLRIHLKTNADVVAPLRAFSAVAHSYFSWREHT